MSSLRVATGASSACGASAGIRTTVPATSAMTCVGRDVLIPFAASDVPLRAMYHMAAFVAEGVAVFGDDKRHQRGFETASPRVCR